MSISIRRLRTRQLVPLFRRLRNSPRAGLSHPLGPLAASSRNVAAVENATPSPGRSIGTRGSTATGHQHGREWSWPLVPREEQGPFSGAFECLLQIARTSLIVRGVLAQPTRTAVYGPVCTVVWQGSAGDRRPYADQTALAETGGSWPIRRSPQSTWLKRNHFI